MGKRQKQTVVYYYHPVVLSIWCIRLAAGLSLLVYPFWGIFAVFFWDWADSYILIHRLGWPRRAYQRWDKRVDWISQSIMVYIGMLSGYGLPMIAFALYRLIGHGMYSMRHTTRYFLLFPNLIEPAYLWWVALPSLRAWPALSQTPHGFVWLCVLKEVQEVMVHVVAPAMIRYTKQSGGYPLWMRKLGFHNLS